MRILRSFGQRSEIPPRTPAGLEIAFRVVSLRIDGPLTLLTLEKYPSQINSRYSSGSMITERITTSLECVCAVCFRGSTPPRLFHTHLLPKPSNDPSEV